jgi:predicted acylesterase/phospholipase RssA
MQKRDIAVVMSGGGMNGMLMELGFLKRLRESDLWPRIGVFFGTSAGALGGTMAALGRLDDLEQFLYGLRADETFRPNRLWRLPLLGTHDYALPATIAERLGDPLELAHALIAAEPEVVVFATDVTQDERPGPSERPFELVYSSRTSTPDELAGGVLASSAVNALVLPLAVGDRVATDGGWVRNYPLLAAYERPDVELIVAFRYEPRYPLAGTGALAAAAARLRRYRKLPAARALVAELQEAAEREERGEPAHLVDTLARLSRVAIGRNTALEELTAIEREHAIRELHALKRDVLELIERARMRRSERERLVAAVEQRFASAEFPFAHERVIPRITVAGSSGDVHLGAGWRKQPQWTEEAKRALIERGYELTDVELRAAGIQCDERAFEAVT